MLQRALIGFILGTSVTDITDSEKAELTSNNFVQSNINLYIIKKQITKEIITKGKDTAKKNINLAFISTCMKILCAKEKEQQHYHKYSPHRSLHQAAKLFS